MNLHGLVSPYVGAVNPLIPVSVQVSTGPGAPQPDGTETPGYATPGSYIGGVDGLFLTVTRVNFGVIMPGQSMFDHEGNFLGTVVLQNDTLGTGVNGGVGDYLMSRDSGIIAPGESISAALALVGQVQPMTWRDLQQLDGVNLGGVKWKIYLNGEVDAIVRPERKGGDLITISTGRHTGVWLVVQILEQFPDWCCAAIVQQNDVLPLPPPSGGLTTDLTNTDNDVVVPLILTGV